MSSRRMISGDIFTDDFAGGNLNFFEFTLWTGLFTACADDQGRLRDNCSLIRATVFPLKLEDVSGEMVEAGLQKFADCGKIIRYKIGGRDLVQIVRWWENQPMSWASPSKEPPPPGWVDRFRYHGKGNVIISQNWDCPGGLSNRSSELGSGLGSELPSREGEGEVKGEGEGKEAATASPDPAKPFSFASYGMPETVSEASAHPAIKVYKKTTARTPGKKNWQTIIEVFDLLLPKSRGDPNLLAIDLAPYWQAWKGRRRKDGHPYDPENLTWLTEWALNENIPPQNGNEPQPDSKRQWKDM